MEFPLVSVITPLYNCRRYLGECIESIMSQTYPNWEQIIVDDGSTDGTYELAKHYADLDPRIRVLFQENKGIYRLSETYNLALSMSSGSLIAVLEGDDFWPRDKLEVQTEWHLRDPELLLTYGRVGVVSSHSDQGEELAVPSMYGASSALSFHGLTLLRRSNYGAVSVMLTRRALESVGGFQQPEGFPAVDLPTWIKVERSVGKIAWIDHVLGFWRQSDSQVSSRLAVELAEGALQIRLRAYKDLSEPARKELGVTRDGILKGHRNVLSDVYLGRMRDALKSKDRDSAQMCARKLIRIGNFSRKLQSAYAFVAAPLGLDLEYLIAIKNVLPR